MTEEFSDTHIVTFINGKRREVKIVKESERHYDIYYQDKLIGMANSITGINEMMRQSGFMELLDEMDKDNCNA